MEDRYDIIVDVPAGRGVTVIHETSIDYARQYLASISETSQCQQFTAKKYPSQSDSEEDMLSDQKRFLEGLEDNLPNKLRQSLPVTAYKFCLNSSRIKPIDLIKVPEGYRKRIINLRESNKMVEKFGSHMRYSKYNPAGTDHAELVTDLSSYIVNDRNCYYTKYEYSCPKCGKKISFVDVLSIRFLEKEDPDETGSFSFLKLSYEPVTTCPECNTELVFEYLFYDVDLLKKTISYKLAQKLKQHLEGEKHSEKILSFDKPMPDNVPRSVAFVGSEVVLASHGYSYVVNTYECCKCHKRYMIGDLNSVRKEPYFIAKHDRQKNEELTQCQRTMRELNLQMEQEKDYIFPKIQWGISPFCVECGNNFYFYDLYEGEPMPAVINLPYDESLYI